ncbi:MAG: BamA/TamA family outer membrane protein, partial [Saprospiraceae bacterium]|nr:BamA/TamA family outer membrane protein [Saprospiraceae bacterium]
LLQTRLNYDQNGRDISTLYMDNGYLFFQVNPIEKGIDKDSVDIEIRISEGPIARVGEVRVFGNDRTHEHVIRRELRVMPGDKFSRSAIIRSQRELAALGLFDPEAMTVNTPVNPQRGTVDVEFGVEERPSDQLELSAGWGGVGQGVIGTLGVTFNNFSLRNLFKPETWSPLPQGDGQRLSLRVQTNGRFYQSYNFSFTEPWLGGKKPTSFTVAAYHSAFSNGFSKESSSFSQLLITGASVSVGTRLRWPDDYFVSQTTLGYQRMALLRRLEFEIPTGIFHNLSLSQTISRSNIANPIFPKDGSNISLSAKLTLPYSLFTPNRDYESLDPAEKFRFVEYHRWDFLTEWYTALNKNGHFVLKLSAKMGFLGYYNQNVGLSPFERYELGGDGISNFVGIQGRDIISLRGYRDPVLDVSPANEQGAAIYNKFTAEFRYLISPNPSATVYVLAFLEGGNAWSGFKDYNPFNLKRSAGLGVRVYLPMFGTLGFDYGIGFDKPHLNGSRKFTDYGAFNIVLGFEPK